MIHFLVGKPRNGKSLRAMMHIVRMLETTDRDVVTNMVLDLDELQQLLDTRGHNFSVRHRVRILTDAEARNFWMCRGRGYDLPRPPDYDDKNGADVDYSSLFTDPRFIRGGKAALESVTGPLDLRGTCYVVDEAHNYWPARGYQNTPRHATFYCSQHGKLNDECFFITQNTKLIDPNFYRLAQDFTYCRNHRLLKFGMFRGDDKFVAKTYESPAVSANEVTLNVETFRLDLAVARCYDTSAGVGMPGGGTADKGARAKGVPLKMVILGLAAVLALFAWFFTSGMEGMTRRFLAPALGGKPMATQAGKAASGRVAVDTPAAPASPSRLTEGAVEAADRVTGKFGDKFAVTWREGWVSFAEAADTPARREMLVRFSGWQTRPTLAAASR